MYLVFVFVASHQHISEAHSLCRCSHRSRPNPTLHWSTQVIKKNDKPAKRNETVRSSEFLSLGTPARKDKGTGIWESRICIKIRPIYRQANVGFKKTKHLKAEKQHAVTRFVHQRALCNTFVRAARKENELKYLASVLK